MSTYNYLAVVKFRDGTYISVTTPSAARGIAPVEVWIFGAPTTKMEQHLAEVLQPALAQIPPSKVHCL